MTRLLLLSLAASTGTWFLTAVGAASVILFKPENRKLMNVMLGFASGVMIAASFWSLLQPAVEQAEIICRFPPGMIVTSGFISGAVFIRLCEKIISEFENKRSRHLNKNFLLILSITLHNIPEGLAVGIAFGALHGKVFTAADIIPACSVALGIGIQNLPEGAAVSLPLRHDGCSVKKSFFIGQASGMVEPVAAVIGALLVVYIQHVLPFALSFAAGAMILVAVHELIPECQNNREAAPYSATVGIICGFSLMTFLDTMLS